jgi:uncharacterized membrane protein YoaK (UPF0700 family)
MLRKLTGIASKRFAFPRLSHLRALYLITGVCGLVDAACFLSLGGVFAEIMTGNLLFLCFSLGTGRPIEGVGKYVLVLAAFAVGAAAGGRLVRGSREETRVGFGVQWLLLGAALLATLALHPGHEGPARDLVVSLLALAMGLQNALIRRHGVPDLATNVMTLTVTALIAESRLAGGRNERWERRLGSVAVFLVSATLGAALTSWLGPWAPLLLALALFTLALSGIDPRGSARH